MFFTTWLVRPLESGRRVSSMLLVSLLLGVACAFASEVIEMQEVVIARKENLGLTVVQGKLTLPGKRPSWEMAENNTIFPSAFITLAEPPAKDSYLGLRQRTGDDDDDDGPSATDASLPTEKRQAEDSAKLTFIGMMPASAEKAGQTEIVFKNTRSGEKKTVRIQWSDAKDGDEALFRSISGDRSYSWRFMHYKGRGGGGGGILKSWIQVTERIFQEGKSSYGFPGEDDNSQPQASLLSMVGGRAAVDETLQMQQLMTSGNQDGANEQIPLAQLKGVEVASLPFKDMLAKEGAKIRDAGLANCVPTNRAFFHAVKPSAIRRLLLGTSPAIKNMSALALSETDWQVFDRYVKALGLTPEVAALLWQQGLAKEFAVFAPDLFFADGTDVTLIVRMKATSGVKPLLSLLKKVDGLSMLPMANGRRAWMALHEDLFFMSTHAGELQAALALARADGLGSLGKSEEFQYMLHKLPLSEKTEGYVYLSDEFIRRLVGPEVKIGQFRRTQARLAMESILGGALLRRFDVPGSTETLGQLAALDYVEKGVVSDDVTFDPATLEVRSRKFGPLSQMYPISEQAESLRTVSSAEATAYKAYMEGYTEFWGKFFDPIALRLNSGETEKSHELEVFVLPLVNNTLYNEVRAWVPTDQALVTMPVLDRDPVAMMSVQLPEKVWSEVARARRVAGFVDVMIDGHFYDLLGPVLHLAVVDADPVLRLGRGAASRAFSVGQVSRRQADKWMMMAPMVASVFTRPCQIMVELSDSDQARKYLESASVWDRSFGERRRGDWVSLTWSKRGENEYILGVELMGTISWDFSIRVEDKFLVVSNFPWGTPLSVKGNQVGRVSGLALNFWPRAMSKSLPVDYATVMQTQRQQALAGMAELLPWMAALRVDADEASAQALGLLGHAPIMPPGSVTWNHRFLSHERFGSVWRSVMPEFKPGEDFGTFNGIDQAGVSMQFEDTGLRTLLVWEDS